MTNFGGSSHPGLSQVESELQARLFHAKAQYEQATAEAERLLANARQTGLRNADDALAIGLATQIRQAATARYVAALKDFSEFVLGRRISRY